MKMNDVPSLTAPITRARIAKTIARNVLVTAASCGLFPNGAPTKSDHEASESPRMRCTPKTSPPPVPLKIR